MKKNIYECKVGDYIQLRTKYGTLRGKVYGKLTHSGSGLSHYYIDVKNKFTVDGNKAKAVSYCPLNAEIVRLV